MEANLVRIVDENGQKIVIFTKSNDSKEFRYPLSKLTEEDQKKALDKAQNNQTEEPKKPTAFNGELKKELEGNLESLQGGKRLKKHDFAATPLTAFYFSASWCPPCCAFTPKLVEFYEKNKAHAGTIFEIILVGKDRSDRDMENYMFEYKMPWPALRYRSIERSKKITAYHGQRGIPHLVLIDAQGTVLSDDNTQEIMRIIEDKIATMQ